VGCLKNLKCRKFLGQFKFCRKTFPSMNSLETILADVVVFISCYTASLECFVLLAYTVYMLLIIYFDICFTGFIL